jgi:hypothetical protein
MVSGGGGAEQDLSLKTRARETRSSGRFFGENEIPPQFIDVICLAIQLRSIKTLCLKAELVPRLASEVLDVEVIVIGAVVLFSGLILDMVRLQS